MLHKCNKSTRVTIIGQILLVCFYTSAYGESTPLHPQTHSHYSKDSQTNDKDDCEECRHNSYGLGDFLINEEKFLYPKAFDKKLNTTTSGGAFSELSIFLNTFGTEYGFVFNEDFMTSHHYSQKHIAFDFGKLSFGGVGKNFPQFFGAKFRYEYGFSGQDSHRFGIEGYWHPTFFNIRGWQILSLYVGSGYRDSEINGAYVDKGILILSSSPIYFALTHRTDYSSHYPSQDSLMFSIRAPVFVWGAPLAIPFTLIVYGGMTTSAR